MSNVVNVLIHEFESREMKKMKMSSKKLRMLRVGTSVICPKSVVVIQFEWSTRKKNQERK